MHDISKGFATYYTALLCRKEVLFITNTAGDKEYERDEVPHLNTVAFYLEGVSDFVLDGGNSVFIIAQHLALNFHQKQKENRKKFFNCSMRQSIFRLQL